MTEEISIEKRMRQEELVKDKYYTEGNKWQKLYFGGGSHFRNWLEQ